MTDTLAGRYRLGDVVGEGAMGRVLEAIDLVLQRRVAVKLLRDELSSEGRIRERFLREARAAASFSHPCAVAVFDAGRDGDRSFLVTELIDGPSLAQVLGTRGPLPADEAITIMVQILSALSAAHDQGLVHRDIKPGNVLLTANGQAKLADFGIAKSVLDDHGLTLTGEVMGTPCYLSPEQAAGQQATASSDIYSAAVVLYEMLAGDPPFRGHPLSVALAHQRDEPPPLGQLRGDLDRRLVAAVETALRKAPEDRFADTAQFAAALRAAGTSQRALAQPGAALPLPLPAQSSAAAHAETVALDDAASAETVALDGTASADTAGLPPGATDAAAPPAAAAALHHEPGRRSAALRRLALLGAAPLLVLAGVALASLTAGDAPQAPPATTEPLPQPPPVDAGPGDEPAGEPPAQAEPSPAAHDLDSLIAMLRQAPDDHGEKTDDLRTGLEKVSEEQGRKQRDEARKLMEEIDEWTGKGELDPEIGDAAVAVLEPLARPPGRAERDERDEDDD